MVITKSISRFARNTVTLLSAIRELKAIGVDVFFEEQNIHSVSTEGEVLLTLLAGFAQEESRSVSENQKWRIRKNFEEGKPWDGTLLGYRLREGTIRKLKEKGVEVYFEKEAIWTFDSKGELMLTIMSSLAQEESRSISENVTWGKRKQFADGKITLPYKHFLGYRKGTDGLPEIVPEEAEIVRRIYRMFIEGMSVSRIAKTLTEEGVPTPAGKTIWQETVIKSILTNEKYKGDARLQKKFTTDYLTKTMKVNEGEVPQYYVNGSHPAIIDPEAWDKVQKEFYRRKESPRRTCCNSPFSGKLICGDCGSIFGTKIWHSTDRYKKVVWQCNSKFKGKEKCQTPHLSEEQIKEAFIQALSILISNREQLFEDGRLVMDALTDCSDIDEKLGEIQQELDVVAGLIDKCVQENATVEQNQDEYDSRYNALTDRYEGLLKKKVALEKERMDKEVKLKCSADSYLSWANSICWIWSSVRSGGALLLTM